ncbi:MAG: hypothetical protein NTY77_18745 [Elusimicrobia bacterium]|nr:hypothetical protein [Elusimicrobiota bacterium]
MKIGNRVIVVGAIFILLLAAIAVRQRPRAKEARPRQLRALYLPYWSTRDLKPLSNNLADCQKSVQTAIEAARANPRWGDFGFKCGHHYPFNADASVTDIQLKRKSAILRQWPEFVRQNAAMFGLDPQTIFPGRQTSSGTWAVQRWNGVYIHTYPLWTHGATAPSGDDLFIRPLGINTRSWTLNSIPSVSSATATSMARQKWLSQGLSQGVEIERIDQPMLSIEIGLSSECGTPESPVLVWKIYGKARKQGHNPYPNCWLNAHSGEVCGRCDIWEHVTL